MIKQTKLCVCDACGGEENIDIDGSPVTIGWTHTEIGDLCRSCSSAWENYKESFIQKMRMDNKNPIA